MQILNSRFVKSATRAAEWPESAAPPSPSSAAQPDGVLPELALCGRSNVGKSTLLNALLQRKSLARVSRTPGRTRLINFFAVELRLEATDLPPGSESAGERMQVSLADLPGFGYAQVSRQERVLWRQMIEEYLTRRDALQAVALLCDSRRALDRDAAELLHEELEIARFLMAHGRAVVPVLTKADKLAKHERKPAAQRLEQLFAQRVAICAGIDGDGVPALWRRLALPLFQIQQGAAAWPAAQAEAPR